VLDDLAAVCHASGAQVFEVSGAILDVLSSIVAFPAPSCQSSTIDALAR
jgi:hypothetical protein